MEKPAQEVFHVPMHVTAHLAMTRAAGLQAIEVIDLDHEPTDQADGAERWRTVMKGTSVWIQGLLEIKGSK